MSLEVEDFLHVCQCCRDSSCGEQSAAPPAGQDVVELKVESDSPHVAVRYSPTCGSGPPRGVAEQI